VIVETVFFVQEDESAVGGRSLSDAAVTSGGDVCAASALHFDEDECEVEDFVPVEIPPPMDEIQTHTLPTQQHSVSCPCVSSITELLTCDARVTVRLNYILVT